MQDCRFQEDDWQRKCREPCNAHSWWSCEDSCSFDFETLGDCEEMPFGFVNNPGEEGFINPCFFLRFDLIKFWKPQSFNDVYELGSFGLPWETLEKIWNMEEWKHDTVVFDCGGKIVKEELDMFTQIVEQKNKPVKSQNIQKDLETFANDKELVDKLVVFAEKFDKFVETSDYYLNDTSEKNQDMFPELKEHLERFSDEEDHLYNSRSQEMLAESKRLLIKLVEYGENVFRFNDVKNYLYEEYNKPEENIDITFFPNSQGIPRKYFPFIGDDYEQPLVAIKLNLNKSE